MATSRTSYGKLQRDRAKKERQQLKRERRFDRGQGDETDDDDTDDAEAEVAPTVNAASTEDILTHVAELHRRFDNEEIDYEDFEEQKLALMAQLTVD